jgi:hypothetical protein
VINGKARDLHDLVDPVILSRMEWQSKGAAATATIGSSILQLAGYGG